MMENEIVVFKAGAECKFYIGGPTEEVRHHHHHHYHHNIVTITITITIERADTTSRTGCHLRGRFVAAQGTSRQKDYARQLRTRATDHR